MSSDCIFCKIISGEIPSTKLYSDESVIAFRDINPVAPTHILIVPKKHIASINELTTTDEVVVGHLFTAAKKLAQEEGITEDGYRLIINTGAHAGQAGGLRLPVPVPRSR